MDNERFTLPKSLKQINSNDSGWISNNNFYWLNGMFVERIDSGNKKTWPSVNFSKLCKNEGINSQFNISIIIQYQFDNDIIKSEKLDYIVTVGK